MLGIAATLVFVAAVTDFIQGDFIETLTITGFEFLLVFDFNITIYYLTVNCRSLLLHYNHKTYETYSTTVTSSYPLLFFCPIPPSRN